jgi:hypothetical protein
MPVILGGFKYERHVERVLGQAANTACAIHNKNNNIFLKINKPVNHTLRTKLLQNPILHDRFHTEQQNICSMTWGTTAWYIGLQLTLPQNKHNAFENKQLYLATN